MARGDGGDRILHHFTRGGGVREKPAKDAPAGRLEQRKHFEFRDPEAIDTVLCPEKRNTVCIFRLLTVAQRPLASV
jgi:hypothetical protein